MQSVYQNLIVIMTYFLKYQTFTILYLKVLVYNIAKSENCIFVKQTCPYGFIVFKSITSTSLGKHLAPLLNYRFDESDGDGTEKPLVWWRAEGLL